MYNMTGCPSNTYICILGVSEHSANCAKEKRPQFKIFPFYKENSYNRTIREDKLFYSKI